MAQSIYLLTPDCHESRKDDSSIVIKDVREPGVDAVCL